MIGKARTIVACVVALIGATAIAVPVGTYFNTARTIQYKQVTSEATVRYGSPLPSPPDHGKDYEVRVLTDNYRLFADEVGTKGITVVYIFEPKPGTDVPRLRHVVSYEVIKGKAVPADLEADDTFKKGGTDFPYKTEAELPDPPQGFIRPWIRPKPATSTASTETPTFIYVTSGKPLLAATLRNIQVGQRFTATYESAVDDKHYEGPANTKYVVTYTVVA